jgi:hypothetical protein
MAFDRRETSVDQTEALGDEVATLDVQGKVVPPVVRPDRLTRVLSWSAMIGIGVVILVMLFIAASGPSRAVVHIPRPSFGPPWWFRLHLSTLFVTVTLWTATAVGGAALGAGMIAVKRGWRPRIRPMIAASLLVTAAFAVLPPAGSTDALDYAAYGRIVVLGHSPYVETPYELKKSGDPIGKVAPDSWIYDRSVYGPLATMEQAAAAELGGRSAARITFWLKLWDAIAFGAVVLGLDRLLRSDPGRRARAHLLWSLNPLLLWGLMASGHVDAMAAVLGFFGLVALGAGQGINRPSVRRALLAGLLIGAAADVKITFGMFGLGVAWAARKSPRALVAAAAGALVALVPPYLYFGRPAIQVLVAHGQFATIDNLYRIFAQGLFNRAVLPGLVPVATVCFLAAAVLLLWWLPEGFPDLPAVRPALALSLAWLFFWPYQRAWYDAMILCLLALYPISKLDVPVLVRLTAATFFAMPGMPGHLPHGALNFIASEEAVFLLPSIRLLVALGLIYIAFAAWRRQGSPRLLTR